MTKRRSKKKKSGSHGYGSSKKNRGAGSRGGRGKAGSGKKASHDRMGKEGLKKMGEHGFKPFHDNEQNGLNLRDIDQRIEELVEAGLADEEDGTFVVNLDGRKLLRLSKEKNRRIRRKSSYRGINTWPRNL
ncbi:MAG: hypothetical protein BRC30_00380 [Nanohaloarchaea archaeon SW_7_46_7]|nr:MAG: hypothetical protein BRC30_00380 [Nanohaloarchaea archaeon SW_7_46_7]